MKKYCGKRKIFPRMLKLERLSAKFQRVLEVIPLDYPRRVEIVKEINLSYEKLIAQKDNYENFINREIETRELSKEKKFKTSFLNIKLQKFKDYSSELDIYSFQNEFEKL